MIIYLNMNLIGGIIFALRDKYRKIIPFERDGTSRGNWQQ